MKIRPQDWLPITDKAPREGDAVFWHNGVRAAATHSFRRVLADAGVAYPAIAYIPFEIPRIAPDLTGIDRDRGECNRRWHKNYGKKEAA